MKKTNTQAGFSHVAILAVIVVVAVVGFAGWRVANNDSNEPSSSIDTTEQVNLSEELAIDPAEILTIEEVQQLAGDAEIVGIELENEDGQAVYVLHLSDGSKLYFDARNGNQLQLSDDGDDEIDDDVIPSGFVFGISMQRAIEIAKEQRPNSLLEKVEVEVEDGVVVYSVRFTDESRVDVNATNGSIQRVKDETGEDSRKEDTEDEEDEDEDDDDDDSSDRNRSGSNDDEDDDDEEDEEDDEDDDDEEDDEDDDDDDDDDRSGSNSGSN